MAAKKRMNRRCRRSKTEIPASLAKSRRATRTFGCSRSNSQCAGFEAKYKTGDRGQQLFRPFQAVSHGWNERMFDLAYSLEFRANVPVMDTTGLTNRFDFDLDWHGKRLEESRLGFSEPGARQSLALELVPTNMAHRDAGGGKGEIECFVFGFAGAGGKNR